MSDIVERLRRHISLDELDADDQVANVPRWEVEEAAAEIERLRQAARLASIAISAYRAMYPQRTTGALNQANEMLREALGDE
jgi:hypothetical protein